MSDCIKFKVKIIVDLSTVVGFVELLVLLVLRSLPFTLMPLIT